MAVSDGPTVSSHATQGNPNGAVTLAGSAATDPMACQVLLPTGRAPLDDGSVPKGDGRRVEADAEEPK